MKNKRFCLQWYALIYKDCSTEADYTLALITFNDVSSFYQLSSEAKLERQESRESPALHQAPETQ